MAQRRVYEVCLPGVPGVTRLCCPAWLQAKVQTERSFLSSQGTAPLLSSRSSPPLVWCFSTDGQEERRDSCQRSEAVGQ